MYVLLLASVFVQSTTVSETTLLVAVVFFALGFGTGFIAGTRLSDGKVENIRLKIAVFITIVWATTVVAGIFLEYTPSIYVHAIMGAIAGYLFGSESPLINLGGGGK